MLVRALLVVLTILNLGVALWWATQPQTPSAAPLPALLAAYPAASAPAAAAPVVPGSAVVDAPASTALPATASPAAATALPAPVEAPSAAAVAAAAKKPAAPVCLSLGPYPDRVATETAAAALGTAAPRQRLREVGGDDATSFRDYYPIRQGDAGNAIALGQYRSREGANAARPNWPAPASTSI